RRQNKRPQHDPTSQCLPPPFPNQMTSIMTIGVPPSPSPVILRRNDEGSVSLQSSNPQAYEFRRVRGPRRVPPSSPPSSAESDTGSSAPSRTARARPRPTPRSTAPPALESAPKPHPSAGTPRSRPAPC